MPISARFGLPTGRMKSTAARSRGWKCANTPMRGSENTSPPRKFRSGDGDAAINHYGLSGHEASGLRREHDCSAGNLVRLSDTAKGCLFASVFQHLRIFPKRARKIGADQARRDAVDPYVVRSKLDGEIARQLQIRRLGNAIGADDRAAAQAADRGDDDDRAVLAGDHLR